MYGTLFSSQKIGTCAITCVVAVEVAVAVAVAAARRGGGLMAAGAGQRLTRRWAEGGGAAQRVARRRPWAAALGSTHAARAVPKALLACPPGPAGGLLQRCGRSARVSSPRASAVAHSPPPQRRRARGGVRRQARCEAPGAV